MLHSAPPKGTKKYLVRISQAIVSVFLGLGALRVHFRFQETIELCLLVLSGGTYNM